MNLQHLKVGQRLTLSFSLVIALLFAMAALAYVRVTDLSEAMMLSNQDRYPKIVLAPHQG